MKRLIGAAFFVSALSGCVTEEIYREGDVDAQAGLVDNSVNPYKINYDLGQQRVSGSGKSECWCWFFSSNEGRYMSFPGFSFDAGVSAAKASATFNAVENAKADALMGAMYRYVRTSKWLGFYKSVKCDVIGFPAFVNGIEKIEDKPVVIEKDQQIIRMKPWEKIETLEPQKKMLFNIF